MLPAPSSIATTPSPKSRTCWKPAVPPPPVAGAAVGTGLGVAVGLGVTVGLGVAVGLGVVVGLGDTVRRGDTVGLAVALGVVLAEALAVAEALAEDDDVGNAVGEPDVVQAETAAEASMIRMPQPMVVSLARTFMKPHLKGPAAITVKAK
jgi:hypothetical protein